MNTRSMTGSVGSARSVSMAGPMRSSMMSVSPASAHASRASAVYSSLTSQHSSEPPGTRPRAMQIDE